MTFEYLQAKGFDTSTKKEALIPASRAYSYRVALCLEANGAATHSSIVFRDQGIDAEKRDPCNERNFDA